MEVTKWRLKMKITQDVLEFFYRLVNLIFEIYNKLRGR